MANEKELGQRVDQAAKIAEETYYKTLNEDSSGSPWELNRFKEVFLIGMGYADRNPAPPPPMKVKDGDLPAYPLQSWDVDFEGKSIPTGYYPGMTIRQLYAGQVVQGVYANHYNTILGGSHGDLKRLDQLMIGIGTYAWAQADALLRTEREADASTT